MAAPAGNSFSANATTANLVFTGSAAWKDCRDLLTVVERICINQNNSVDGYSNTQLANYLAFMTYSNTGNFGYPTARFQEVGVVYNGNTTIQGFANCLATVLSANT